MPKGANVIPNLWAMSRDETLYKNADDYRPERFEGENPEMDPQFVFGFGRRICAGIHFADASLYIVIAYVLATFHISKAKDANGKEIEPSITFTPGLVNHLDPFACNIVPRSPRAASLIRGDQ